MLRCERKVRSGKKGAHDTRRIECDIIESMGAVQDGLPKQHGAAAGGSVGLCGRGQEARWAMRDSRLVSCGGLGRCLGMQTGAARCREVQTLADEVQRWSSRPPGECSSAAEQSRPCVQRCGAGLCRSAQTSCPTMEQGAGCRRWQGWRRGVRRDETSDERRGRGGRGRRRRAGEGGGEPDGVRCSAGRQAGGRGAAQEAEAGAQRTSWGGVCCERGASCVRAWYMRMYIEL